MRPRVGALWLTHLGDVGLRLQKEVLGLQVAVANPVAVKVLHRTQNLPHKNLDLREQSRVRGSSEVNLVGWFGLYSRAIDC